ncbi:MAG: hypothetical protein LBP62_03315 [Clostridiales bacterium]|jgi:hypothetical protein|nr:hypothetical protein [Clostridiales bacterium]
MRGGIRSPHPLIPSHGGELREDTVGRVKKIFGGYEKEVGRVKTLSKGYEKGVRILENVM